MTASAEQPFIVRGHHTESLWDMERMGTSPAELADTKYWSIIRTQTGEYVQDVYGSTHDDAQQTMQGMERFFADFHDLAPDASVRFTAKEKDGVCASCVLGSHCEIVEDIYGNDVNWVGALEKTAQLRKLTDQIEVVRASRVTKLGGFTVNKSITTDLFTNGETAHVLVSDRLLPVRAAMSMSDRFFAWYTLRRMEKDAFLMGREPRQ